MWWLKQKSKPREQWSDDRKRFTKFYASKEWKRLKEFKRSESVLCECCLAGCSHVVENPTRREIITPGWAVDHIIPLAIDYSLRLEYTNTQMLCLQCHSFKTSVIDYKMKINKKIDDNHQRLNDFD